MIVQPNQGGQVKALLQSPAKTPQLQQQQVIVKQQQGATTPVVQKINPANTVVVSGGQVLTGGQQVVVSGNQVITTGSGQQVKTKENKNIKHVNCSLYIFQLIANQILVNNQNLAQQLATGKVQVATINGQQVLIRPTGNNQAQVVAQLTPSTICSNQLQATQVTTPQSASAAKTQSTPKQEEQAKPVQQENNSSNQIDKTTMEQLLIGQPPGTVIKCVTAQVIQTQQGPRIVLQGLQGADFTQQQLAAVQQQVKQQLLKGKNALLFSLIWFYLNECNSKVGFLILIYSIASFEILLANVIRICLIVIYIRRFIIWDIYS